MPFKLTKAQNLERKKLADTARAAHADLETAIEAFNIELFEKGHPVTDAADDYRIALADIKSFCNGIKSDGDDAFAEKSDSWQESDRASAVTDWLDRFDSLDFDECCWELPEPLDAGSPDVVDEFEDIDDEPSY
jgi:hypothetical protein